MPDTRKVFTGTPNGFSPGQGRMNDSGEIQYKTIGAYDYEYHVTIEEIERLTPQTRFKVKRFHVSFYNSDMKWAGIFWSYKSSTDRFEITERYWRINYTAAEKLAFARAADGRVAARCRFEDNVYIERAAPVAAPVVAAVAAPVQPVQPVQPQPAPQGQVAPPPPVGQIPAAQGGAANGAAPPDPPAADNAAPGAPLVNGAIVPASTQPIIPPAPVTPTV
jgi:hypothetical protein